MDSGDAIKAILGVFTMFEKYHMYRKLRSIAYKYNIDFNCLPFIPQRLYGYNQLCMDYDSKKGYILYTYNRDRKATYHSITKDANEFIYAVFKKLCMSMGIKYERAHPLPYMHDDVNNLSADSRKAAFEYSLYLLKQINPEWYERTIPEYERFLNLWRDKKNVYFDREIMQFKEK